MSQAKRKSLKKKALSRYPGASIAWVGRELHFQGESAAVFGNGRDTRVPGFEPVDVRKRTREELTTITRRGPVHRTTIAPFRGAY